MAARRPSRDRPDRSGDPWTAGHPLFGPDPTADTWDAAGEDADVAPAGDPEVLSVPQVAARIRGLLDQGFPRPFWMVGEVSGLKRHGSGHWYLSLVDDEAGDPRRRFEVPTQ